MAFERALFGVAAVLLVGQEGGLLLTVNLNHLREECEALGFLIGVVHGTSIRQESLRRKRLRSGHGREEDVDLIDAEE